MRGQIINLAALDRIRRHLGSTAALDFSPLMRNDWEEIIAEDNRKGVLEGKDGWDRTAPPLRYRNGAGTATKARTGELRGVVVRRFKGFDNKTEFGQSGFSYAFSNPRWFRRNVDSVHTRRQKGDAAVKTPRSPGTPRGHRPIAQASRSAGAGAIILPNNNLSTAAYKRLTGPRLAPRRESSRVITNLFTRSGMDGQYWFAEGTWKDVVDENGNEFLQYHFEGKGVARYDLQHVRRWGVNEARRTLREFVRKAIRYSSVGTGTITEWAQKRPK